MQIKTLLTVFLIIVSFSLLSQNINKFVDDQQVAPFQKLYLHTDREFYFYGDTLWFAAYLVNGQSHEPTPDFCNLYVELIDTAGEVVQKELFPIDNGTCPGYLSFSSNNFKEGNFLLRAYTDYLKNFGDDSFFEKNIQLSTTKNSYEPSKNLNTQDTSKIDLQFFPEGGFLLANQKNLVAFKAINGHGKAININGKISDENGKFICAFNSIYKGMGKFHLNPSNKSKYNIEIEGYPGLKSKIPEVQTNGSKIIISQADKEFMRFKIVSDEVKQQNSFFIVMMHRGKEMYVLELNEEQVNKNIQLKTNTLKEGINRIVLLNSELNPLSERLVFVDSDELKIDVDLTLNEQQYQTRENVKVQIQADSLLTNEFASLSVAVVNENALNAEGTPQNIKSYLLVDSELSGPIPPTADFFLNNDTINSQEKLDLLMLTNGWKNYIWNNIKKSDITIKHQPTFGFSLKGNVLKQNGKEAYNRSKVILNVQSKNLNDVYSLVSDKEGIFATENIQFYDTATVFVQGKNQRNKNKTKLELDSLDFSFPVNYNKTDGLKHFSSIPLSFYRLNYNNTSTLKEFYPSYDTRLIEEIEVKADKPEQPDGHHRIYEKPKLSLSPEITDLSYSSLFKYLSGKSAGVRVSRFNEVFIGDITNVAPLLLLNGIPTNTDHLASLNMLEVDKIEVLKRNEAAIYGTRAAGGVLSVWTKRGELRDPASIPIPPGTIVKRIKGFVPYREFYSPKYTSENINSEAPDVRTTLYWNPKLLLEDGIADVSFFSCDNFSRYKIFVEGITNSGTICLGSAEFEVNRKNDQTGNKEAF